MSNANPAKSDFAETFSRVIEDLFTPPSVPEAVEHTETPPSLLGSQDSEWDDFVDGTPLDAEPEFREHATGAVRSKDADETRYDLISPIGLEAVARTCAEGAAKYGDFNWEKGFPVSDILNHALRHIYLYLSGDRSEPHLPHAAWNLLAAIHSEVLWPHLNTNLRGPGCTPPCTLSVEQGKEST